MTSAPCISEEFKHKLSTRQKLNRVYNKNMTLQQNIFALVAVAAPTALLIFLASREVFCWYIKINKIESLLEKIAQNTDKKEQMSH